MTVIDGIHRLHALRQAHRSEARVRFIDCDEDIESIALAIQANARHGKPLSRSERVEAARLMLSKSPERSDRWLGEVCGLSHSTIARIRMTSDTSGAPVRLGRDGRRRSVSPEIGRSKVEHALTNSPGVSFRQVAKLAGVSPSTAQRVAKELQSPRPAPSSGLVAEPQPPTHPGVSVPNVNDRTCQETVEPGPVVGWLERTAIDPSEAQAFLSAVPLGRVYDFADECRTRSRAWADLAVAFEDRARSHYMRNSELGAVAKS